MIARESRWRRYGPCVLFGLIFLLAALLRFRHLGSESFEIDEFYSMQSAMGRGFADRALPVNTLIDPAPNYYDRAQAAPWWRIWPACTGKVTGDAHPPLPYILLRWWCDLFGYSDATARALSAVESLAGLWLLFLVGRELHGVTPALWACLIMALALTQIQFAQEVKHYALLQAEALAACLAIVRIEKRGGSGLRYAGLALGVLAMMLTHYFSVAAIAALGLYALLRLRGKERRYTIGAMAVAGFVFAIAWGPSLLAQIRDSKDALSYFRDNEDGFLSRWLTRLARIPYRFFNEPLPDQQRWTYLAAVLFVLPALLVRRRRDLLLWALWIPFTILSIALLDLVRRTWLLEMMRYVLIAAPAIYLVIVAAGTHLRPALRSVIPIVAVICCVAAIARPYNQMPHKVDTRRLARELAAHAAAGDVTIFCSPGSTLSSPRVYFACISYYARPLPGPMVLLTQPADDALLRQLRARARIWVIGDAADVQNYLPGARRISYRSSEGGRLDPRAGYIQCMTWPANERTR